MNENVKRTPEEIVQEQLDAYNARDIEAFVRTYSPEVEIFQLPEQKILAGHAELRERYSRRFENPKLHADLVNRMVLGNFVIDFEHVSGIIEGGISQAIAIYEVADGVIRRVWFAKP